MCINAAVLGAQELNVVKTMDIKMHIGFKNIIYIREPKVRG